MAIEFGAGVIIGGGPGNFTIGVANPPTYSVAASGGANSINEGSSLTVNVTTAYVDNGTTLYWTINNVTTSNTDFSPYNGSFTINNNTGSFSISPIADVTTEGSETCTVSVRTLSTSGTVVATSNSITVNDTSITPVRYSYLFPNPGTALVIAGGQGSSGSPSRQKFSFDSEGYGNDQPWTIEGWFKSLGNTGDHQHIFQWAFGSNQTLAFRIDINENAPTWRAPSLAFYYGNSFMYPQTNINYNTWYHFALIRTNSPDTYYMYLNGNLVVTTTSPTSPYNHTQLGNYDFNIGAADFNSNGYAYRTFNGYISNLRITRHLRVYTGNFTPPTSPLTTTQSAGTNIAAITGVDGPGNGGRVILLTAQSSTIVDNSVNALTIGDKSGFYGSGTITRPTVSPFD